MPDKNKKTMHTLTSVDLNFCVMQREFLVTQAASTGLGCVNLRGYSGQLDKYISLYLRTIIGIIWHNVSLLGAKINLFSLFSKLSKCWGGGGE